MYKEVKISEISKEMIEQLQKGAFLTVSDGEKVNTMTIGWGAVGYMWNKPVFTAMVRYSRYTYEIIDKSQDFTVSFPLNNTLNKELGLCGTKSGRDIDKVCDAKLVLKNGELVNSPIIDNCELHIECKIVYKQGMDEAFLNEEIKNKAYPNNDYHVMYFGEIVKAYIKE
jgi:flavin reductase (DIM6/NTAB) family NADH-FMN oxidoreductase RutF